MNNEDNDMSMNPGRNRDGPESSPFDHECRKHFQ